MLDSRIPEFSDKELENLHGNAKRLAQSGTPAQRAEAERLLPLIGVEVEKRAAARTALQRERLAAAKEQRAAKSRARKAANAA